MTKRNVVMFIFHEMDGKIEQRIERQISNRLKKVTLDADFCFTRAGPCISTKGERMPIVHVFAPVDLHIALRELCTLVSGIFLFSVAQR